MKYLRKTLEFGFSATLLSTLLLTACGGGGGTAAVGGGATGTSVTLTPVKGKFQGNCNIVVRNSSGATLFTGTQAINANGTTTVTLAAGTTGPYLVSIQGDAAGTCKYFNEANQGLMTMLSSESLNAYIPSNYPVASGVAVTALTNMAYHYASAVAMGRPVADNNILAGAVYAWNAANLPAASAVTDLYAPPAANQIPQSGVAAPTHRVMRALYDVARTSANAPMSAVQALALQAQIAGLPAASSVAAQTQLTNLTNGMTPATGALPFNNVMAGAASAVLAVAYASNALAFITDAQNGGLRAYRPGVVSVVSGIPTTPAVRTTTTVTASNGIYTFLVSKMQNLLGTWTAVTDSGLRVLGSTGWIDPNATPSTAQLNADGTVALSHDGYGMYQVNVSRADLNGGLVSGVPSYVTTVSNVSWTTSGGSAVPVGRTIFTAGDAAYSLSPVSFVPQGMAGMFSPQPDVATNTLWETTTPQDVYYLSDQMNNAQPIDYLRIYSLTGTTLTTLPTTPFCLTGDYYVPNASSVPAGSVRMYDVYSRGSGMTMPMPTATSPCYALGTASGVPAGTPATPVQFLPSTVNGQAIWTMSGVPPALSFMGGGTANFPYPIARPFSNMMQPPASLVIATATINGTPAARLGWKEPQGGAVFLPWSGIVLTTKTAMNKIMTFLGLPTF